MPSWRSVSWVKGIGIDNMLIKQVHLAWKIHHRLDFSRSSFGKDPRLMTLTLTLIWNQINLKFTQQIPRVAMIPSPTTPTPTPPSSPSLGPHLRPVACTYRGEFPTNSWSSSWIGESDRASERDCIGMKTATPKLNGVQ